MPHKGGKDVMLEAEAGVMPSADGGRAHEPRNTCGH